MRPIVAAYIVKQLSADQNPTTQRRRAASRSRSASSGYGPGP